jgi:hypothetical protein
MVVCLRVETTIFSFWGGYGNLVQQRLSWERWLGFAGIRRRKRQIGTDLDKEFDGGSGETVLQEFDNGSGK